MARKPKKQSADVTVGEQQVATKETLNLGALMSSKVTYQHFAIWLIGTTPIICHSWSEKAKRAMLQKQAKATKAGKEARNPEEDFVNSLYPMGTERKKPIYGFP